MRTTSRKPRPTSSRQRHRRREEQLEFDLAPPEPGLSKVMPDLGAKPHSPAASDTRWKRLQHGVLVQQFLK